MYWTHLSVDWFALAPHKSNCERLAMATAIPLMTTVAGFATIQSRTWQKYDYFNRFSDQSRALLFLG
jgi:hypothetical protein